uniref:Uncharacterized protein n=1 Tax=Ditylenchus dipsaci TaxID=166011 RepID=A0A915CW96_9BILA
MLLVAQTLYLSKSAQHLISFLFFAFCAIPHLSHQADPFVQIICARRPSLRYCPQSVVRRAASDKPPSPFKSESSEVDVLESDNTDSSKQLKEGEEEFDENQSNLNLPLTTSTDLPNHRQFAGMTPAPVKPDILYTILPSIQKKTLKYCPLNQYTFMTTCSPGKSLRYDLQVFCADYSEMCGVPNINLFPSRFRNQNLYRPHGYGQKQENGHLGVGRSLSVGLGVVPGLTFTNSKGVDVGSMPGLDQIGGMMFNDGTDVGILGERVGHTPDRAVGALGRGFPTFGLAPGDTSAADKQAQNAALRSLGIPPVPGLGKILGGLQSPKRKQKGPLYEPGYDAINKHSLIATGRTDGDKVSVPMLGTVESTHGVGIGIG